MASGRNRSTTLQILTIRRILEGVRAKKPSGYNIICRLYKGLWFHTQREDGANSSRIRSTKRNRRRVLQSDTLSPYLFIIYLEYVLRTSIDKIKENGFELTKKRSRRYPTQTITDADYADDSDSGKCTRPSSKPYCIVRNEPPQALASMPMHSKMNICAIIKQEIFPH